MFTPRRILLALLLAFVAAAGIGSAALYWGYLYVTRDLPDFDTVDDYRPPGVTRVYARDGSLVAEFYRERRYPVKLADVPLRVRQAFIASEDAGFYRHTGIDPVSIARAFVRNVQAGRSKQGASTITQQVVKNLLLTPERNIERKLKEAVLSYRLEKRLSKDGILEIYLNQIFLGNTAYGVKAAARVYFRKELAELTLAETALLAGLPKAPSRYSPVDNPGRAKRRQRYVLGQMVRAGYITPEEQEAAEREKISAHRADERNIFGSPYAVTELRNVFPRAWPALSLDADALEIHLTVDPAADKLASSSLAAGLRVVDKRRGWRGPVGSVPEKSRPAFVAKYGTRIYDPASERAVFPAMVNSVSRVTGNAALDLGTYTATIALKDVAWARRRTEPDGRVVAVRPEEILKPGDVVEVSVPRDGGRDAPRLPSGALPEVSLDQSPDLEGALVLIDPRSGRVVAMTGGYDFGRSQFNRVTQSYRQPGSSFKPVVYLAAVDRAGYTPATIVRDTPRTFRVGDQTWSPKNFDEKFMGDITLQTALEQSRNLVSVDIVSRIGLGPVIEYAQKLGIRSRLGKNLSLSLGSSETTLLEMTRAYGVLAAKGVLFDTVLVDRILDRSGKVVFDYEELRLSRAKQVVREDSAFVMAHMMKGVIERGTATSVRALGRPVAGKTGTTNDQMDAWFIGFTPSWACGVWVGFDQKREIGPKETGGKVSAPIFLDFMKRYLDGDEESQYQSMVREAREEADRLGIDFVPPDRLGPADWTPPPGVEPFWMSRYTGHQAAPETPGAVLEYFVKGTRPRKWAPATTDAGSYLDSDL